MAERIPEMDDRIYSHGLIHALKVESNVNLGPSYGGRYPFATAEGFVERTRFLLPTNAQLAERGGAFDKFIEETKHLGRKKNRALRNNSKGGREVLQMQEGSVLHHVHSDEGGTDVSGTQDAQSHHAHEGTETEAKQNVEGTR